MPASSRAERPTEEDPCISFIWRKPDTTMKGTKARMPRVNFQLYTNPMMIPVPMLAKLWKAVPKRAPVAYNM